MKKNNDKPKLVFYPVEYIDPDQDVIIDIDNNVKIHTKRMVMIRTRIGGYEQTVSVPLGNGGNK